MTDTNDDTALENDDAPADDKSAAAGADPNELATLKNRNSGLNKKVASLQEQLDALRGELETARKGLTDKDSADADLRKQLADAQEKLAAQTRANEVATAGSKYPEAFKELGESILGMKPEQLASLEARLTQAADAGEGESTEPTKPVGNNAARGNNGPKNIEDMTAAEARAFMRSLKPEDMGLVSS